MSYEHSKDNNFVVKDSGVRKEYASGMRRDTQEGKPNYRLIDIGFLTRLAWHLTKGAIKYGRDNWRLANSQEELERFQDSGLRHHLQYLNGETDEDHAMATVFNIMAAEHCKQRMVDLEAEKKDLNKENDVDVFAFMKDIQSRLTMKCNVSWGITDEFLTIYILWDHAKLSRKVDLWELRNLYDEEELKASLVADIWLMYDQSRFSKKEKNENPAEHSA